MTPTLTRALALLIVLALGAAHAQEQVVARYEGQGYTHDVGPFTVEDHWEVRWTTDDPSGFWLMYVFPAYPAGWLITHAFPSVASSGSSCVARGGTFAYSVLGTGAWAFDIVQLDPATFPTLDRSGLTFTGVGTTLTRPFTVDGPWESTWEQTEENTVGPTGAVMDYLRISPYGVADAIAARMPPDHEPMAGINASLTRTPRKEQPYGGTFYLKIDTGGPWTVRIAALQ